VNGGEAGMSDPTTASSFDGVGGVAPGARRDAPLLNNINCAGCRKVSRPAYTGLKMTILRRL